MLPTREKAEMLLTEAEKCNPGAWGNHSRVVAHCAEKIARECKDLDPDKAYILGLLHDIGRKFGGAVHGRDPLGVACASGFPPEVGPAAVAIHNNGHMARDPVHVDIFKQCIEIHM